MKRINEKGNALLFAVIAMTFMSVLGAGTYYLTSTSSFGTVGVLDENRAAQIARAGINYALMMNLGNTAGRDFTFANGDKFRLVISGDTITATGIIKEGTLYEAKETVSVTETGYGSRSDISAAKDIQSFTAPAESKPGFITTDTSAAQISLGKTGSTWQSQFGALWYQGNAVPGNCTGGRCDFGEGFRAFFVFQFGAGSTGDGFTFAFFNGTENDVRAVGGHTGRGELMGYAGASCTNEICTSTLDGQGGRGIQPPKVGIEFDVYSNYGSVDVCASGSRRDGNESPNPRNHVGYVFWGDNTNSFCTATVGRNTYDDNRHGAGFGNGPDMPRNSMRPSDGDDTSYFNGESREYAYNWLLSNSPNVYALRVEVKRSLTANANGNYDYEIKSWVKQCATNDITCPAYGETSTYANTKTDYTAEAADLTRTIDLDSTRHQKFSTFFHGWTTATGGATQNILISRHKMNFRN